MFLSAVLAEIVPSMAVLCCITDWKLGMIPHLHSTLSSVADIEKYCESQWRTATQGLDAVQDKGHEMNKRLGAWRPSCCACHCHIQHVYQTLHTHIVPKFITCVSEMQGNRLYTRFCNIGTKCRYCGCEWSHETPSVRTCQVSSSLSFKQDLSMVAVMASVRSPMLFR